MLRNIYLSDYLNLMQLNPTVKIKIVSYPDDNATPEENLALTKERSNSIREFFISNGIDGSRISIEGSSTIDPNNPPPTGRASKGKRYIGSSYLIVEGF